MKIVNHTHYQTKQLRAIVKLVAEQELDPAQRKYITVHIHYKSQPGNRADRRGRRIQGITGAGLRYNSFCVGLRKDPQRINRTWLGVQLAHEMAECRGLRHRQMRHTRYGYRPRYQKDAPYGSPWDKLLKDMPLEIKPKPTAPAKDNIAAKKLAHAEKMLARWERREKLTRTKLRTWRGRVKRYQATVQKARLLDHPLLAAATLRRIQLDD
jgi:hypothetical protein